METQLALVLCVATMYGGVSGQNLPNPFRKLEMDIHIPDPLEVLDSLVPENALGGIDAEQVVNNALDLPEKLVKRLSSINSVEMPDREALVDFLNVEKLLDAFGPSKDTVNKPSQNQVRNKKSSEAKEKDEDPDDPDAIKFGDILEHPGKMFEWFNRLGVVEEEQSQPKARDVPKLTDFFDNSGQTKEKEELSNQKSKDRLNLSDLIVKFDIANKERVPKHARDEKNAKASDLLEEEEPRVLAMLNPMRYIELVEPNEDVARGRHVSMSDAARRLWSTFF